MTPDLERFLELTTRPLEAVPGERDEAKGELMARVGHGGVPLDRLNLEAPLARLENAKPGSPVARRAATLIALLVLIGVMAVAVTVQVREMFLMSQATMMSFMMSYSGSVGAYEDHAPMLVKHVREKAPGLPLGIARDLHGAEETGAWLERHPEDLAMLQEHVMRRMRENSSAWTGLSDGEKETIGRLDPDNALWPLIQVSQHLARATGTSSSSFRFAGVGGSAVVSEPEFENALRLFSEAAAKENYHDRSLSLKRRQLGAFPRSESIADDLIAAGFAQLASQPFFSHSNVLGNLAEIRCERLATAGDKEGLLRFFREWQQLIRIIAKSAGQADAGVEEVASQLENMGGSITDALDKLGLAAEKAEAEKGKAILDNASLYPSTAPPEIEQAAGARLGSATSIPSGLTLAEALPSRLMELAFLDRILAALLTVLALVFTGLVGLETCRRSRITKGMARGLMPLFQKIDHLWIGGLGIVFPWFWWWSVTRLSPLGLRDAKFGEEQALVLLLQPVAGFVFGLLMLLQTAGWRWGKRGGFLGLGASLGTFGWLATGLAGLTLPAAGLLHYFPLNSDQTAIYLFGVAGMAACGLLWLLWTGVMNLFTPKASALRPNLTMRVVLPWALTGVTTLVASMAISTAMERHWFREDPLFPTWTSKTHLNALEERLAAEARKALGGL